MAWRYHFFTDFDTNLRIFLKRKLFAAFVSVLDAIILFLNLFLIAVSSSVSGFCLAVSVSIYCKS